MGAFGLYLIKVSVCLVLFYLFFKVFMSRDTFFRFNRFILLGGILVCMLLPFLRIEVKGEPTFVQGQFLQLEAVLLQPEEMIALIPEEHVIVESEEEAIAFVNETGRVSEMGRSVMPYLPVIIYFAGCLAVLISLLLAHIRMVGIIRNNRQIPWDGYTLVLSRGAVCPFCWGKYIVISEKDYENHFDEILIHERMHGMKHHTFDLLVMEGFIVLFWFNPAVWLLKKELQEVHEYEADNGVLNQGIDATKYQLLLVKKAAGARLYSIANSFNHSKLKNRITMMLKEKSSQWARLKALLFIPPTAMLMLAFARPETALIEMGKISEDKVIQISEESQHDPQVGAEKKGEKQNEVVKYETSLGKTSSQKLNITKVTEDSENPSRKMISAKVVKEDGTFSQKVVYTTVLRDSLERSQKVVKDADDSSRKMIFAKVVKEDGTSSPKVMYATVMRDSAAKSQKVVFSLAKDKGYKVVEGLATPPPPSPLISLTYANKSGKNVYVSGYSEKEFNEKLNAADLNKDAEFTLQVNRQRNDELQNRVIGLLKEKGVNGEIKMKKGEPAPPLAPLQMAFVYKSNKVMFKDVWQISNGLSFIDVTPADRVKEVILTITPKCSDEMKKEIRDYLTQKGFTQITEKQLDYN